MSDGGVFVLLPVLNEIAHIARLLDHIETALAGRPFTIGIVDDGSRDGTVEYIRERMAMAGHHIHLICRVKKCRASQRGSALRVLMEWGLANTAHDVFIEMDGDLSHRTEEMLVGISMIEHGDCDVAIASKYVLGSVVTNRPWGRRLVSWVCSYAVRAVISTRIRDYSNGYRFYTRAAARLAADHAYRYGSPIYLSEILALWMHEGMRIREFKSTYIGRNEGVSKLRMPDLAKASVAVFEIALRYHVLGFRKLGRGAAPEPEPSERSMASQ
jgi:dolichol-phosphate mannosyltransferase